MGAPEKEATEASALMARDCIRVEDSSEVAIQVGGY
jgi:hypothetical protein